MTNQPTLLADPESAIKHTERSMLDMLHSRYSAVSRGARRYVTAEHVPVRPTFAARIADFIAVDCYRGADEFGWADPHHGYPIHGHEVKVSRSDWLAEMKEPDKAEAFRA